MLIFLIKNTASVPASGSIPLSQWVIFDTPNELDEFVKTVFEVVGVVNGDEELILCDVGGGGANCNPSEFGLWIGLLFLQFAISVLFKIGAIDVGQDRSSQSSFFNGNLLLGLGIGIVFPLLDGGGGFCKITYLRVSMSNLFYTFWFSRIGM